MGCSGSETYVNIHENMLNLKISSVVCFVNTIVVWWMREKKQCYEKVVGYSTHGQCIVPCVPIHIPACTYPTELHAGKQLLYFVSAFDVYIYTTIALCRLNEPVMRRKF